MEITIASDQARLRSRTMSDQRNLARSLMQSSVYSIDTHPARENWLTCFWARGAGPHKMRLT